MSMEKRLMELVNKKFLTSEEIEEIYLMENVKQLDCNVSSDADIGLYWYTVHTTNGEEYDIYTKKYILIK